MDSTVGDCMKCNKSNKICDMVQCDTCQSWAHFSFVGVTEAIRDTDWSCDKYCNELQVPKASKRATNKKGSSKSKSDGGSNQSSVPEVATGLNKELRKLEAGQRAMEKALEEEMILREKRLEMECVLQEKRRQTEAEFREKQLQQDRELKQRQLKEERDMLERQLQEEARFANERTKKAIAESISEEAEGATGGAKMKNDNELSFEKKVQFWLKQQGQSKGGATSKPSCSLIESEECSEIEEDTSGEAVGESITGIAPGSNETATPEHHRSTTGGKDNNTPKYNEL
nr:eukaryotic translation initiation factor 3 subunit A-like [Aedes albopictus]